MTAAPHTGLNPSLDPGASAGLNPGVNPGLNPGSDPAGTARAAPTLHQVAQAAVAWGAPAQVIVVDNDGTDPAVGAAVAALARDLGLAIHYEIEATPGISAARNAVFAAAQRLGVAWLAMLDDDEWPHRDWLVELMRTQSDTGAVVVGGPVRPQFAPAAQRLQRYARYWSVEPQLLHGKPFVFCTCNFLVDLRAIAGEPRPLFDPDFAVSGGEDVVFFRKLFARGHAMAWSARALVFEEVPAQRSTLAWMRRRRYGVGFNGVRWEGLTGRVRAALKTLALTARLPVYPLLRREPESVWVGWMLEADKLRGRYAAHLGATLRQYAAAPDAGDPRSAGKSCR